MNALSRILVAPLVWLAAFSATYALHGTGCALGWTSVDAGAVSLQRAVLLAAWAGAIALQIALVVGLAATAPSPWVRKVSLITGWTGLAATVWTLSPVALTATCP